MSYILLDDFVDQDLFVRIEGLFTLPLPYRTSSSFWSESLFTYKVNGKDHTVSDCLIFDSNQFDDESVKEVLLEYNFYISHVFSSITGKEISYINTMLYKWGSGSSILWHNDKGWDANATLYVNKWDKNWGGELMLGDGSWIRPEPNKIIICSDRINHKVNAVLSECPERLTLQTFIRSE